MTDTLVKRNNWFPEYQEISGLRDGKRKLKRLDGFDRSDFDGKTVLDLGCNIGQVSLFAAECGAVSVLGVEYDTDAYHEARGIRDQLKATAVQYKVDDLDNPLFWHHIGTYDTVLLLSVIDTKELVNRFGILSRACMKCKGVMYFEGHPGQPRSKYFQYILDNTDFTQIEHVGRYERRDLFRCSRDVLDTEGFHARLHEVTGRYDKIAILGNQMAGKTTLRRKTTPRPGFGMLDDVDDIERISSFDKLIFFDYRAAIYKDNWDVVFNVVVPPEKFETTRKSHSPHLRSSEIAPSETLCCLYTVKTHGQ